MNDKIVLITQKVSWGSGVAEMVLRVTVATLGHPRDYSPAVVMQYVVII